MARDIERDDWSRFLEAFAREHHHWPVRVDEEKASLPLEGIDVREARIDIHLGAGISHHRRIVIEAGRVSVETEPGHESLTLVAADGPTTTLRFRSP